MNEHAFFGHPKGLKTLFFTEMWERFSYYGMRAILILYMVAPLGLHLTTAQATQIYGIYTMSVYLFSLPGGWIADHFIGAKKAVLWGGILIALGHFVLAIESLTAFFMGLALIVLGTGLLKPSISALVGNLYVNDEEKRDAGFSIFYMGINLGGFIAPFVCGYLGQKVSWHYGFGAAGVGMTLGIIQYVWGQKYLTQVSDHTPTFHFEKTRGESLTKSDWLKISVIGILFSFSALFWMAFEQAGSSLNLFADQLTRNEFLGFSFPSSWFQSVNPIFIIFLAPLFSMLWVWLGKWQPSSGAKFCLGLFFAGVGFLLIAYASTFATKGNVSPLWLIGVYFFLTIGELCLSPVGLSMVTKLAPKLWVSFFLGIWFVSIALGNYAAGWVAGFFDSSSGTLYMLFGKVALTCLGASFFLFLLLPLIKRLESRTNGTRKIA